MIVPLDLDPGTDRARVRACFTELGDYLLLERGDADPEAPTEEFFTEAPPGIDPATSCRLGWAGDGGALLGMAELAFGYPEPGDAYLGLLLLVPAARGQGLGHAALAAIEARARARGATRLFLGVLDANPRGRAFWLREGFTPAAPPREIAIGAGTRRAQRLVKAL